jgi:hypothetical protein
MALITPTNLGSILRADSIDIGDEPSYQLRRTIFIAHPLGADTAETAVCLAQSQQREIDSTRQPG